MAASRTLDRAGHTARSTTRTRGDGRARALVTAGSAPDIHPDGARSHESTGQPRRRWLRILPRWRAPTDRVGISRRTGMWGEESEVVRRELARNAATWAALRRLGVDTGTELSLTFVYQTAGARHDRHLADHLRSEPALSVEVDAGGVTCWTRPLPVSPEALDRWVTRMVRAGRDHGGVVFSGWTAAVSLGASTPAFAAARAARCISAPPSGLLTDAIA